MRTSLNISTLFCTSCNNRRRTFTDSFAVFQWFGTGWCCWEMREVTLWPPWGSQFSTDPFLGLCHELWFSATRTLRTGAKSPSKMEGWENHQTKWGLVQWHILADGQAVSALVWNNVYWSNRRICWALPVLEIQSFVVETGRASLLVKSHVCWWIPLIWVKFLCCDNDTPSFLVVNLLVLVLQNP